MLYPLSYEGASGECTELGVRPDRRSCVARSRPTPYRTPVSPGSYARGPTRSHLRILTIGDMEATVPRPLDHRFPSAVMSWVVLAAYPIALTLAVGFGTGDDITGAETALPVLVLALPALLLPRWPAVGFASMVVGVLALTPLGIPGLVGFLQAVVLDLAVAYLAATRSRLAAAGAAATALVAQVAAATLYTNEASSSYVNVVIALVLAVVIAWLAGTALRQRRDYRTALLARAATDAVTTERLRIARDLHDQVAHSIGVIAIQAGVGRRVIDTQPEEARKALDAIETASRETLAGLRRMLVALRRSDTEPAATETHGLADLDRLVAATDAAGVRARVRIGGEAAAYCRRTSTWPRTGSSRRRSPTWCGTRTPTSARSRSGTGTRC